MATTERHKRSRTALSPEVSTAHMSHWLLMQPESKELSHRKDFFEVLFKEKPCLEWF